MCELLSLVAMCLGFGLLLPGMERGNVVCGGCEEYGGEREGREGEREQPRVEF